MPTWHPSDSDSTWFDYIKSIKTHCGTFTARLEKIHPLATGLFLPSHRHNSPSKLNLRNNQTVRNVCGCNNNAIFSERTIFTFPTGDLYRAGTLVWQRRSLHDSCQSGKMAALLNSLFFVFKISFLPKYRVKYYDYIVKWCSGIECNWCVSLDTVKRGEIDVRGEIDGK